MSTSTFFFPSNNVEEENNQTSNNHDWLCPQLYEEIDNNLPSFTDFDASSYECNKDALEEVCHKCFFQGRSFFNFSQALQFVRILCLPWGMAIKHESTNRIYCWFGLPRYYNYKSKVPPQQQRNSKPLNKSIKCQWEIQFRVDPKHQKQKEDEITKCLHMYIFKSNLRHTEDFKPGSEFLSIAKKGSGDYLKKS